MTDRKYYKIINGEPMLSTDGMALLMGITAEEMRAEFERQRMVGSVGLLRVPIDWIRSGRRRRNECAAALGHTPSMLESLDYWAARD